MACPITHSSLRRALLGCMFLLAVTGGALGDEFRIETKIFTGDKAQPVSETTTLFVRGAVYDFIVEPPQIAVFRKPAGKQPGRFILLDPEFAIQTELTTEKISGAMDKLRSWAGRQNDPFLQFAADPQFRESFKPDSGELVLASHIESYKVTTERSERPQALTEYREFLDWYARLNTLLSAGPPPDPRLRLNEALARRKVVPLKVELTRDGEDKPIRAEHEFTWRLSEDDRARIDEVGAALASYSQVSNEEFLKTTRPDRNSD